MNDRLNKAMRQLAAGAANVKPAVQHEVALFDEFDQWNRRRRGRRLWMSAVGLAAAAFSAIWVIADRQAPPPVAPAAEVVTQTEEPFVPIPYVTPLGPYERADVVRVNVPVTALIAAGARVGIASPGGTVQADVIVGQDGRAHAIRLVSNTGVN